MKTYDVLVRQSKADASKGESNLSEDGQIINATRVVEQKGRVGKILRAPNQSGFTASQANAWSEVVERVQDGHSAGVAFGYFDRSGRNWWGMATFYAAMEAVGGEIVYADMPNVDYRTPEGRMMTGLQAVVAEVPYHTANDKGATSVKQMLARGVANRVPYGYRRNGGRDGREPKINPALDGKALIPDPETAPVVRRIFELRALGTKWSAILAELEAQGIPSPGGGKLWPTSTLAHMVKSQVYLGHVVFGGEVVKDAHDALVDRNTWKRAQSTEAVVRTGRNRHGVAGGLLVCGTCQRTLSVGRSGTTDATFYACRRTSSSGRCPKPVHITQPRADDYVDAKLREMADGKGPRLNRARARRDLNAAKAAAEKAQHDAEEYAKGTIGLTADAIRAGMEAHQANVERTQAAYDELLRRVDDADTFPISGAGWDALDVDGKRAAAAKEIERIVVAPFEGPSSKKSDVESRLHIVWR